MIYNGKGKPTIMQRDEFDKDVAENRKKVLVSAGLKDCVDTFRIGSPHSHEPSVREALQQCAERAARPQKSPPAHNLSSMRTLSQPRLSQLRERRTVESLPVDSGSPGFEKRPSCVRRAFPRQLRETGTMSEL